jgi:hypothetical protein
LEETSEVLVPVGLERESLDDVIRAVLHVGKDFTTGTGIRSNISFTNRSNRMGRHIHSFESCFQVSVLMKFDDGLPREVDISDI